MRIKIVGSNATALGLAGHLRRMSLVPVPASSPFCSYRVEIEESSTADQIVVDGVDCELERDVVRFVADLAPGGKVLLQRGGGVQDDSAVKITVPMRDDCRHAVELGVARAFSQAKGAPRKSWLRRFF